jgi:cell division protein FtsN
MKKIAYLLILVPVLLCSCGGAKKSLKNQPAQKEEVVAKPPVIKEPVKDTIPPAKETIVVKEEKVTPLKSDMPAPSQYFVIIGSFRYPDNAASYQKQILHEGFTPVLLKNEQGLIRVSVLATDDILKARSEIKRIRDRFPKHADTWLLIQKK